MRNYQKTIYACYAAYVVQAVVNNFAPLLFVTFQSEFALPLSKITALVTVNFTIQLILDLCSAPFIDRIGYRASMILANACCVLGLLLLTVLPGVTPDPYVGLTLGVAVYALGGGLLEVLVSPIVEACPTENKEAVMSLLHSFYCWGQAMVVLVSTIFFAVCGIGHWRVMACVWALLPLMDLIAFTRVPIAPLIEDGEKGLGIAQLVSSGAFWLFMLLMICAGTSEQAVSQWASAFAETGLGVTKTVGDLLGPLFFAVMMGTARTLYGKLGARMNLKRFMMGSAALCIVSYLLIGLSPSPVLGLLGCGLTGFSVGIFWPGTFSLASKGIRNGGTLLFAMLALGGDIGCSAGPTIAGLVASALGGNLHIGILSCVCFPVLLGLGLMKIRR